MDSEEVKVYQEIILKVCNRFKRHGGLTLEQQKRRTKSGKRGDKGSRVRRSKSGRPVIRTPSYPAIDELSRLELGLKVAQDRMKPYGCEYHNFAWRVEGASEVDHQIISAALGYVQQNLNNKALILTADVDLLRILNHYQRMQGPGRIRLTDRITIYDKHIAQRNGLTPRDYLSSRTSR